MLTGKCKEDFEKWLITQDNWTLVNGKYPAYQFKDSTDWKYIEDIPFRMMYGVYVDFFDSVGIKIEVEPMVRGGYYALLFGEVIPNYRNDFFEHPTRNEARQKAIEKANLIYNENRN